MLAAYKTASREAEAHSSELLFCATPTEASRSKKMGTNGIAMNCGMFKNEGSRSGFAEFV